MKMKASLSEWLHEYKWEIAGAAILLFVVFINLFPSGYIIDSGDVIQFLDLKEHYLNKNFYDSWILGRISIFFSIFYFLDFLGISNTGQLSWYLGLFLFSSYFSFLIFCQSVLPRVSKPVRALVSLFYATNIYTLYIFTSTWGFIPYQVLYVFIPALTGLYMRALWSEGKRSTLWFLAAVFIASMGFSNPAFAVSTAIYFSLLTVGLFLFRLVRWEKAVWIKIVVIATGTALLNIYWILPLIPKAGAGIEELGTSTVIVLSETLRKTSNSIFDSIRLMQTSSQEAYYPENFPYPEFSWMKPIVSSLAFVPFFIIIFGLFQKRVERERKLQFLFFGLFVVFILLVARVRFPFTILNDFLFQLPVMNALRGYDKLAIFVPFIMSASLLIFFSGFEKRWSRRIALGSFLILSIILALPFYFGGIQTRLSQSLMSDGAKDFRTANYSALVKIPQPYYDIAQIFDKDKEVNKISMLPYSPGSSVGKVSLPVWKVNGPSVANVLYDKQYVELSVPYVQGWNFAEDFDITERDPRWITDIYGLIGIKYVIFHKDAKSDRVLQMEKTRKYLESIGALNLVTENNWFRLYTVQKEAVFPYVYGNNGKLSLVDKSVGLTEKISEFRDTMKTLSYDRTGPKKMIVDIQGLAQESDVFLNEKFDPLWKAEYRAPSGERVVLARDAQVKYANAWKIGAHDDTGKIEISYMPMRLFFIGMWISGVALVSLIGSLVYVSRKEHNS